ncbi:hypothetical protein GIB67_024098 [Kingdonia uniflora]|uniref:GBF-interacting protein 1 N-terminal domain-containing protein n=1 Tax=Kingdonia uniflora TaxID=39325 RepID=A0A7J7MN35_9MAGN|nr:hypothetical protein GIB67_024098 [Kingdonia uniflora]
MSSGGGNGGRGVVVPGIPASSKKMVQSLKEIVNCPEHEIYAMLKECDMDPNDTVHRLLSQDPFHEVKSKREKKKEIKETSETRPRGVSSTSNRGGRGGAERQVGRSVSTQFSSKPAYKKENGPNPFPTSSTYVAGVSGSTNNRRPTSFCDSVTAESKTQTIDMGDFMSSSPSQPSPVYQPAWVGVPGQVSMADIVKMGRPQAKASQHYVAPANTVQSVEHSNFPALESHHHLPSSWDPPSNISEAIHELPAIEQSSASGSAVSEPSATPDVYADSSLSSSLHTDMAPRLNSRSEEIRETDGGVTFANLTTDSISNRQTHEDGSGKASHFGMDSFTNTNSYQDHVHAFEDIEGINGSSQLSMPNYTISTGEDVSVAVSSAAAKLQQLGLRTEEIEMPPARENPAVILPNHLQVPTSDLSHLSFGSFGGISATYPGSFASNTLKNNLEEAPITADASSVGHSDTRNADYFGDEQLQSTSDNRDVNHRTGNGAETYDSPSSSQPEVIQQDTAEPTRGHQYNFSAPVPGYTLENNTQQNAAYAYPQANSQMQSHAPLASVMQAYTSSLQNNLPSSTDPPSREADLQYFLATQSMPTKYTTAVSSISGPTISMPENVKPGIFSTHGSNIASGQPTLSQHLALHPYAQQSLPLGAYSNMFPYPYGQNFYLPPSSFQQAYAANNTYPQSPAAAHGGAIKYTLPPYKNPTSSLPQSTGYGGFASSANIPANYQLNPSSTHSNTSIGYEDVLGSQYKDSSHYASLQQNENWLQGHGSRTVSPHPAAYYSIQGQNQQHSGYRQGQQQPSQHYGAAGYPSFYHSQAGISQDQQQNPNDGSQGQQAKQSHQMWPHY